MSCWDVDANSGGLGWYIIDDAGCFVLPYFISSTSHASSLHYVVGSIVEVVRCKTPEVYSAILFQCIAQCSDLIAIPR